MIVNRIDGTIVTNAVVTKAQHALGLEESIPQNDKVIPLHLWEEVVESIGNEMNCLPATIERAKSQYTYYMLYHYAPMV